MTGKPKTRRRKARTVAAAPRSAKPRSMAILSPGDAGLREFIADFNTAMSLMRTLRRTLAAVADLSATEYVIMLGLWHCERYGKINVRDLAEHLHLAAAHVTAEIGQLTRAGLVTKKVDAVDKRAVDIRVSAKGHALLHRLAAVFGEVNLVLFAGVPYPEMTAVHRFLTRLIQQAPGAIKIAERHVKQSSRGTRRTRATGLDA